MTPQALTALKQSIEHWRRLATGQRKPDESVGPQWCALCEVFNRSWLMCKGCPVREKTGQPYCRKTPWTTIETYDDGGNTNDWLDNSPEARALAAEELAFLESLLPEES